mmetsp:Transcript_127434/g.302789  ORF Transcript_127434/g.302789 Transcript_127434/m.302789 type:complete len:252 (-) Transcript_127434:261-1016(-)
MQVLGVVQELRGQQDPFALLCPHLLEQPDGHRNMVSCIRQSLPKLLHTEALANVPVGGAATRQILQLLTVHLVQGNGHGWAQGPKRRTTTLPGSVGPLLHQSLHLRRNGVYMAALVQAEVGELGAIANLDPIAIRILKEELGHLALTVRVGLELCRARSLGGGHRHILAPPQIVLLHLLHLLQALEHSRGIRDFQGQVAHDEVVRMLAALGVRLALDEVQLDVAHGEPRPVAVEVGALNLLEADDVRVPGQ